MITEKVKALNFYKWRNAMPCININPVIYLICLEIIFVFGTWYFLTTFFNAVQENLLRKFFML